MRPFNHPTPPVSEPTMPNRMAVKSKHLPSYEFVQQLFRLNENTNSYDRKNHILTIRNYEAYCLALNNKLNRSPYSFEKQLKMLGFRRKKVLQTNTQNADQKDNQEIVVLRFQWSGKRDSLIAEEIEELNQSLQAQLERGTMTKKYLKMKKEEIDRKLESVMFTRLAVQETSNNLRDDIQNLLAEVKATVNAVQETKKSIVFQNSKNLGHQLELFRLLVSKEVTEEKQ